MRASPAAGQGPQPLPLPLPPPPLSLPSSPAAPRRRGSHHRASCSSSSAASTSSSSFCPSPSPPASPPASLVPFSWERHAGVPKASVRDGGAGASPTAGAPELPLPPPLRPAPRRRRAHADVVAAGSIRGGTAGNNCSDPFVAAFAECTRDDDVSADHPRDDAEVSVVADRMRLARTKPAAASPSRAERRWWLAGAGGGFLDLYGCKSAIAVADGAFLARRPVGAHGRGSRR